MRQLNPLSRLRQLGSAVSFGDKGARERWEAELVWFRLRYLEADGPTRCLSLLSRPQACGRVALCYQPDAVVSRLYLGVPDSHTRLLHQMAADFDFLLKPPSTDVSIPAIQRMMPVSDLPWDRPFLAHIVDSGLFLQVDDGSGRAEHRRSSRFLPDGKSSDVEGVVWRLLADPPSGLTQRPSWNGDTELGTNGSYSTVANRVGINGRLLNTAGDKESGTENVYQPPAHLIATSADSRRWLLGRSGSGIPLHVAGQLNLYGRQEAVAEWLVHQVTQMISIDPTNLIIIDGAGDLVPRLKRKSAVTRLLGKQITYVDIDGAALTDGFNPLAAVPGETDTEIIDRWQRWFQAMNVSAQGVALLPHAQQEGVTDIPALRKWLKSAERQGQAVNAANASYSSQAVSSLNAALNRLTASRGLREWLEWPAKSFDGLPDSALLFACKGTAWDREQLLRAVLLAAYALKGVRLIVHGFSWKKTDEQDLAGQEQVVVGNGPLLPGSTVMLTECHAQGEAMIADRFLNGNALIQESLSLLTRGEGMILVDGQACFTSWNGRNNDHYSVGEARNA